REYDLLLNSEASYGAGGFARALAHSIPEEDRARQLVSISDQYRCCTYRISRIDQRLCTRNARLRQQSRVSRQDLAAADTALRATPRQHFRRFRLGNRYHPPAGLL